MKQLMCAPLQGFTESPFREAHAHIYGHASEYFTPFVRYEKGEVRKRDLRDSAQAAQGRVPCTPQVIAADVSEFRAITEALIAQGHKRIDLNAGCPFPPQVRHGRGAGLLAAPDILAGIAEAMNPAIAWSVKIRLGVDSPDQWRACMPVFNDMPLRHICVHPRTAVQQYAGELHYDSFAEILELSEHPVVFNGDLRTPDDIRRVTDSYPEITGMMAGRGLLYRPSLFAEFAEGVEWPEDMRRKKLLELHSQLLSYYTSTLCGDSQILMKIKPYWEYFGQSFERRAVKTVIKARTLTAYMSAVSSLY